MMAKLCGACMNIQMQNFNLYLYRFRYQVSVTKRIIAVTSTSWTGTEVTDFAVITGYEKGIKFPLASYELTPDIAFVD